MLNLYAFFHLNLMFSSVEEDQRPIIIQRCYWPLLRLARRHKLPIGIEAPACTLEFIQVIDPLWINELKDLIHNGNCEFIGSGYTQLIGPLVPAEVNSANLSIGMDVYKNILDLQPSIALVNEQAYSASLVPLYRNAGYDALIMEWNNPHRAHPEWDTQFRYHPQYATGVDGSIISLIWNESIAFQKFQRYVQDDISLPEYLDYIRKNITTNPRCFPLYGSDAEIFDFRPGRFVTESPLQTGEWDRIDRLLIALSNYHDISWISPSAVLDSFDANASHNILQLESIDQPIPVKKQEKYNIFRWALSGRDDLDINRRCYKMYYILSTSPTAQEADWKELCFLWSSDFRTHITETRFKSLLQRLEAFETRWSSPSISISTPSLQQSEISISKPTWSRENKWLTVSTNDLQVRFNCKRGLAIEHFIDRRVSCHPMFGTIHHGRFDDITWGADFYSGHVVFQSPGAHQITDLQPVDPSIVLSGSKLTITASIPTPFGEFVKIWTVNALSQTLHLTMRIDWPKASLGRFLFTPFTLFPDYFDSSSLSVSALNGGTQPESFSFGERSFDHGKAVSYLVSSQHGFGLTDGTFRIGDKSKYLCLEFDPSECPFLGQLKHHNVDDSCFTRVTLTARELDDTAKYTGLFFNASFNFFSSCNP